MRIAEFLPWAVVAVLLAVALRRLFVYPAPDAVHRHLGRGQAAFLRACAEAMFPAGGAVPVSGLDADLPGYMDRYLIALPAAQRVQISALLLLIEHATLVFPAPGPSFRRFSSLPVEKRVAVLEGWAQSRIAPRRFVFAALRALLTMGYLGHPGALDSIGMAPYVFESPVLDADLRFPPIGAPSSAVRYTEADRTPPSDGTPLALDGPRLREFTAAAGQVEGDP